jgi:hypothetical protein
MRFHVEPGFSQSPTDPRYFVRALHPDDEGRSRGYEWEVQFLDGAGSGGASVELGPADGTQFQQYLSLHLPEAVLEAARRGISDYVDQNGNQITFSGAKPG